MTNQYGQGQEHGPYQQPPVNQEGPYGEQGRQPYYPQRPQQQPQRPSQQQPPQPQASAPYYPQQSQQQPRTSAPYPPAYQVQHPQAQARQPPGDEPRNSSRRTFLLSAAVALPVAAAGAFLLSKLAGGSSGQAQGGSGGVDPGNYDPSSLPTAAGNPNAISLSDVHALISKANAALKNRDRASFVSMYAPGAAATQAGRMFDNIGKIPFDYLAYELIGNDTRQFVTGSDATVGMDVALVHQITDVDVEQVAEWYRWSLSKAGDGKPVLISGVTGSPQVGMGGAKYVYYPHPWDSSHEITVVKNGSAILCAETPGDAAIISQHAQEAATAIQNNHDGWVQGGGKSGLNGGALMMAAHTRDSFYSWFSGEANQYGNEAGLTIPMVTAKSLASGSPVVSFGSARITLDVTTPFFTVDRGSETVQSLLQHEDMHKYVFPLLSASQSTVPLWVVEGFADFMATRTYPNPVQSYFRVPDLRKYAAGSTEAGSKWDGSLPNNGEVYSNDVTVGSGSYCLAALAYYYIYSLKGMSGAVGFLEANYVAPTANSGTSNGSDNVDNAFQSVLGMGQSQFVAGWQGYIKQQVGVSAS